MTTETEARLHALDLLSPGHQEAAWKDCEVALNYISELRLALIAALAREKTLAEKAGWKVED